MQKQSLKIRLRYCGGCNPEIDRGAVVRCLQDLADSEGFEVSFNKGQEADLVLLVNGCPHACLEEGDLYSLGSVVCISVQGTMVDRQPAPRERLPYFLFEKLKGICLGC
jgi:hypothetical protein